MLGLCAAACFILIMIVDMGADLQVTDVSRGLQLKWRTEHKSKQRLTRLLIKQFLSNELSAMNPSHELNRFDE